MSAVSDTILVTGAGGCIGAWVLAGLLEQGATTIAFDLNDNQTRLRLLLDEPSVADAVVWECGDIADRERVHAVVAQHQPAAIIHLAALQVPFCQADPTLGAQVNVVGTVNVFEAAKQGGVKRVVYASSVAADAMQGEGWLKTLYGAYKICNEQTAQVYWREANIASVGIRPSVVYGAGRDQGLSAAPSLAMLAAVAGMPYDIAFTGPVGFVFAPDVAMTFIRAATLTTDEIGAHVFNDSGVVHTVEETVALIHQFYPNAAVSCSGAPLPFPAELPDNSIDNFLGDFLKHDFATGVRSTLYLFARRIAEQRIDARQLLGIN